MATSWWNSNRLPGSVCFALWEWEPLAWDITRVLIYVFLGLAFFAVAYLILDKVTPFSFGQEIRENKNTAMAIVLGSVFIGIALILAAAIRG